MFMYLGCLGLVKFRLDHQVDSVVTVPANLFSPPVK